MPKYWHRTPIKSSFRDHGIKIREVQLPAVYNSYWKKYHMIDFFSLISAISWMLSNILSLVNLRFDGYAKNCYLLVYKLFFLKKKIKIMYHYFFLLFLNGLNVCTLVFSEKSKSRDCWSRILLKQRKTMESLLFYAACISCVDCFWDLIILVSVLENKYCKSARVRSCSEAFRFFQDLIPQHQKQFKGNI